MQGRIGFGVGLVVWLAVWVAGCCQPCRERQAAAAAVGIAEVPVPYRLEYQARPTIRLEGFGIIAGGREFVLAPDLPEEVWQQIVGGPQ